MNFTFKLANILKASTILRFSILIYFDFIMYMYSIAYIQIHIYVFWLHRHSLNMRKKKLSCSVNKKWSDTQIRSIRNYLSRHRLINANACHRAIYFTPTEWIESVFEFKWKSTIKVSSTQLKRIHPTYFDVLHGFFFSLFCVDKTDLIFYEMPSHNNGKIFRVLYMERHHRECAIEPWKRSDFLLK